MARLQIVTLPTLTVGAVSRPEFLIVIDEVGDDDLRNTLIDIAPNFRETSGARGMLVFEGTVEVVR